VIRHIVWDWNGTLFDDQQLVVEATNASLRAIGVDRHVTAEEYQSLYRRPMDSFYEQLAGQPVTPELWSRLDCAFAEHYGAHVHEYGLAADALAAMDAWAPRGQSLLSMFGHDDLVRITGGFGLGERLRRIDGRPPELDFGPKAKYLVRHVEHLRAVDPALKPDQIALVGDTVDDAGAAFHIGAIAVLYTGGSSSREALESVGVAVVDTLAAAVQLIAGL
jgi:phosphoglycolate phosphatase-like HAD superfamily hydrolase